MNDFDIWFNGAPFAQIGGDYDFGIWFNAAPLLGPNSLPLPVQRRRCFIF